MKSLENVETKSENSAICWSDTYIKYCNMVRNVAFNILKDYDAAQDVVSITFQKAMASEYKKELASIGTWLHTIARNEALQELKRRNRNSPIENFDKIEEDDNGFTEENSKILNKAIEEMEEDDNKRAFLLRRSGLSYEKIGEQMELSPISVRVKVHRFIKDLRFKITGSEEKPVNKSKNKSQAGQKKMYRVEFGIYKQSYKGKESDRFIVNVGNRYCGSFPSLEDARSARDKIKKRK